METNMNKYAMFTLKFHKDNAILQAIAEITLIINLKPVWVSTNLFIKINCPQARGQDKKKL